MKEILNKLCRYENLTESESRDTMSSIMDGEATPAQVAAFLVALRMKGEKAEEIYGCAVAMRNRVEKVQTVRADITDTCGTGGDGKGTFNISTAAALIAAGAGLSVAKHGNRSVSSLCGSADVLEALGINLELTPEEMGHCLDETGIAFLYAPLLHKAMRFAAGPRKEMGIRSVFNLLGPLTNPAGARRQVMGVYAPELTKRLARVLALLETDHSLVIHGGDGSDELTLSGETMVCEVRRGKVECYRLVPEDVGLRRAGIGAVKGGTPVENAKIVIDVLQGKRDTYRDISVLNAGAALYVGGLAESVREGVQMAESALDSGAALEKFLALKSFTGRYSEHARAHCS